MATRKKTKPQTPTTAEGADLTTDLPLRAIPGGMTPAQYEFCLNYLANGYNASAAARAAYPDLKNDQTCRAVGYENLTKPYIRAWIQNQLEDRWKTLHMSGDEALTRVALDARADPRALFDAAGKVLKPHEWNDDLANSIEGVEVKGDGGIKVKFASKTLARRTILEQTGKLKAAPAAPQWNIDPATLATLSTEDLAKALEHAEKVQDVLSGKPTP